MKLKHDPEKYLEAARLLNDFCKENYQGGEGWFPSLRYYLQLLEDSIQTELQQKNNE